MSVSGDNVEAKCAQLRVEGLASSSFTHSAVRSCRSICRLGWLSFTRCSFPASKSDNPVMAAQERPRLGVIG